nr:hypothetical protein [Pandoravirus belohorizontensis]
MLISSAGSRQGHDGSRRQPATAPRARPQPQQPPRQEIPQQGHAPRPARIALIESDQRRDGGQHPVPTSDRHQNRAPPIDRAREIAGRQGDHDRRDNKDGRKEEDSNDDDDDDDDDDDEIDEDESYEDEEGADEYRHQFDYNGARSTVEPVQDDEPVYQVRCPAPRHNARVNSSVNNSDGKGQAEDEKGEDDSSDSASSQEGTVSSDDDSDNDDDGYGTLIALCSGWRSARIKVDALSAAAKTLRHERKDLEKRLIDHMSRRKIAGEDAFGSLPGDWRAKVTIVRAPASCSVSDQVLSAAVHKRLSVQMAHDCALAEANKAAKKEKKCSPSGAKKRAPTSALPAPQAKHPRRTSPSSALSEPRSPPAASDRAVRLDDDNNSGGGDDNDDACQSDEGCADHSFSYDAASQDSSSNNNSEEEEDGDDNEVGIVRGISLAKAIGAALAKARREAQETLTQPRFTVNVIAYPTAEAARKHEPFFIPVMTDENGNDIDDEVEVCNRWMSMTKEEKRAMTDAAKAAAAEAAARVELTPEAAQWAGRIYEIDQALERNRAEAGPLRALMAALTVDLPGAQPTTTTTTQSATTPNGNGDDDAKPINGRTKAAEAKRLRHAQHAAMRDRVAAYLAANYPHADERGGLAVRFVSPRSATGGAGAPVTYRIRAVERARNGNMGVRRYATAAVSAAAASLAAVGLDPTRPYSPARLQQAFGDCAVRSHLLDALKRAIAAERQACKPPLARNLVITKAPSGKRST